MFRSTRGLPTPTAFGAFWLLSGSAVLAGQPSGNDQVLDTVVVTARHLETRPEAERDATPGAVTLIDGNALHQRSVTQLADLLRYVPGVWAESYNGNDEVFYSSRGSNLDATDYDRNGIKFLQDGLPVTAADGNNHNRALDPQAARHVTVAHGANALAYGASTLGGAIDFTTPTARGGTPSSATLSAGSFGQWGARATLGHVAGAFDGLLSAETQQRDGYRAHSRQDRRSIHGNLGWQAGAAVSTRFYASYSDYEIELPRELSLQQVAADRWQARPDAIEGDHGKTVETWRLALKGTAEVAGGTLELGASHERQALYHPIVSGPFFSLLIDTDHEDSGAMLRFRRGAGSHELVVGGNYGFSRMTGGNYENLAGERGEFMWGTDDHASTLEAFALDRWKFAPEWTLVYGAQYVRARREADGVRGSYSGLNPRLGVIRNIGADSQWYASASRTYEAPTTMQMTDFGSATGVPLDAMHGLVVETGLRGTALRGTANRRDIRLSWDVSGYYTALRDEILSTSDPVLPGGNATNFARTTHAGIEAVVSASIPVGAGGHRIEPLLSATFNAFSFDSDPEYGNNRLPGAPRHFARGEVMYRSDAGFSAGPTFDLVGRRFTDYRNSWSTGSYGLLGARAALAAGSWELFAEGRNLLDKEYFATVNISATADLTQPMLYPGAPRSVYFGARYQF